MICQRLDQEEAKLEKEGGAGAGAKEDGNESYIETLRRIKDQSDERFLNVAREFVTMIVRFSLDA